MSPPARFRTSRTTLLPIVVLLLCVLPAAAAVPWALLLLLLPVALAGWVLRAGVDVGAEGLRIRTLIGSRPVAWTDVSGIRVGDGRDVWLVTTRGTEVRLPVVRPRDLPRLAELSGGRLAVPQPPATSPS